MIHMGDEFSRLESWDKKTEPKVRTARIVPDDEEDNLDESTVGHFERHIAGDR